MSVPKIAKFRTLISKAKPSPSQPLGLSARPVHDGEFGESEESVDRVGDDGDRVVRIGKKRQCAKSSESDCNVEQIPQREPLANLRVSDGREECTASFEHSEVSDALLAEFKDIVLNVIKRCCKARRNVEQEHETGSNPKCFGSEDNLELFARFLEASDIRRRDSLLPKVEPSERNDRTYDHRTTTGGDSKCAKREGR